MTRRTQRSARGRVDRRRPPEAPRSRRPCSAPGRAHWPVALTVLAVLASAWPATGQERHLYWGDTHIHTSYSMDANMYGNSTGDPDMAYRFARGLPVVHPALGHRTRLDRPLDFLAVSDHSPLGAGAPIEGDRDDPGFLRAAWSLYVDAAERNNDPGTFTALIGWEWSVSGRHRVVFTPTDSETAKNFLPLVGSGSPGPEDLWRWLEETSERLGIDFVAIPHNSNLSRGLMFDMVDSEGRPISAEYARTRMRWEPVVEVLQIKGTSETHPFLSPEDEFASFELWGPWLFPLGPEPERAQPLPANYVRTGLLRGLQLEEEVGVNPYKLGFQGASDTHATLSDANDEELYGGWNIEFAGPEAAPKTLMSFRGTLRGGVTWDSAAQGITGAWASENTREALTAAFKRKEVYATSGPRIQLRMFGGFEFEAEDANARDIAAVGYGGGVPMGGDLAQAPNDAPVSLLIHAVKDPVRANLDRVQVIKGWLDADGETHERVYDVAWAGERTAANGKVPSIGNTVDVARATYENTIGSAELSTVWVDPDFDPDERAFYYVRVLEIPTPRHSTYDAVALGLNPQEASDQPPAIQERAFSSPIWYTP